MTERALTLALIAAALALVASVVGDAYKGTMNQINIDHKVRGYDG